MYKEELLAKLWVGFAKLEIKEMSKAFDEMEIDLPDSISCRCTSADKELYKYIYGQGMDEGFECAIEEVEDYLDLNS